MGERGEDVRLARVIKHDNIRGIQGGGLRNGREAHKAGGVAVRLKDGAAVVPGAWERMQADTAARLRRDPKARAAHERRRVKNAESGLRASARMFSREHAPYLDALRRDCPGFSEGENAERTATALKVAMLEARDKSGLTQAEIAGRMGVRPSNLSRILHGNGRVNGATFAAFLRACGFGFSIRLVPFPKVGRRR